MDSEVISAPATIAGAEITFEIGLELHAQSERDLTRTSQLTPAETAGGCVFQLKDATRLRCTRRDRNVREGEIPMRTIEEIADVGLKGSGNSVMNLPMLQCAEMAHVESGTFENIDATISKSTGRWKSKCGGIEIKRS